MTQTTTHILLVEDDPAHAELISRAFDMKNQQVHITVITTLNEAHAYLANATPNLIITDLRLPDGQGVELLPANKADPAYPVVIMTSHGDEQVAVEAIKAGAMDYVVKTETTFLDIPHIAQRALREWGHIVEHKQMEQNQLELEAQLQQAQKLETVGTLAAGVAHDFNNLLLVINGFAELVQMDLEPDHPHKEPIDKILNAGKRAAELVNQLLAFSRKQIVQPEIINLENAITKTEKMLRRLIGEHILLETTVAPDLWSIKIDPAQLEQLIVNLAVNARDAMPEGGKLIIEAANITLDNTYVAQHLGSQPGNHVRLAISDTGHGMSNEMKTRIFEPFFTKKEVGQGTGLGRATAARPARATPPATSLPSAPVPYRRGPALIAIPAAASGAVQAGVNAAVRIVFPFLPRRSVTSNEPTRSVPASSR